MKSERSLVKKILYVISGLKGKQPDVTDIELLYKDGAHVGFKIEIKIKERPRLSVVSGEKKK